MAKGERYEVLVGLTYPTTTDLDVWARIWAGDNVSVAERKNKRAEVGAIVSDIPERSIPWLLAQGAIRRPGKGQPAPAAEVEPAPVVPAPVPAWTLPATDESEAE